MTIIEAIRKVLSEAGRPLSAPEIYKRIVAGGHYEFHADDPASVVRSQIRRHCKGLSFPSASATKHFAIQADGTYGLLVHPQVERNGVSAQGGSKRDGVASLRSLYRAYEERARSDILRNLQKLDPKTFELFSKRLLEAYGFTDVQVTRYVKDGGLDGHGKLRVGLANMNVAFQCKRYAKHNVQRTEIDAFRGAIQGRFDQGIVFTTSAFVKGADQESFRPGAVPIVLIDGKAIVNIMIEKRFGIQVETLPIYTYALDMGLGEDK